ncbi:hypothetical protein FACS189481_1470 [Clostridia bacterium]|nr:hypothetical protein FACS189481_1470 [Clostridia bacterium]
MLSTAVVATAVSPSPIVAAWRFGLGPTAFTVKSIQPELERAKRFIAEQEQPGKEQSQGARIALATEFDLAAAKEKMLQKVAEYEQSLERGSNDSQTTPAGSATSTNE